MVEVLWDDSDWINSFVRGNIVCRAAATTGNHAPLLLYARFIVALPRPVEERVLSLALHTNW
ncbi:MAG: hypothetical protein ABFS56_30760 [Pseudomonadota bacterium]